MLLVCAWLVAAAWAGAGVLSSSVVALAVALALSLALALALARGGCTAAGLLSKQKLERRAGGWSVLLPRAVLGRAVFALSREKAELLDITVAASGMPPLTC